MGAENDERSALTRLQSVSREAVGQQALPAAVQFALSAVASQLRARREDVAVRSWERVNWSDECLDLPLADSFACTAAVIPGYRILFEVQGGGTYEYHTDIDGSILLRSIPPQS